MANFTDRLKVIVDWDGKNAENGLTRFRKSVSEAHGVGGKFKAGISSAFQAISANAGAMAVAAGAAIGAFATKAINAFTNTAKAAIDLSKATGLTVEQASRWIEVGGDYGVTAENIASAIGRLNKDLDSSKWEKYGIATRDAGGNARDTNAIFMDVLEVLNNTSNGAERGRIATELLGRGWQGISPLLGHTRAEYDKMLGAVGKGKVITDGEAKRAERWRLKMDDLSDSFEEFQLELGQSVIPVVSQLADIAIAAMKAINGLQEVANSGNTIGDALKAEDIQAAATSLDGYNRVVQDAIQSGWSQRHVEILLEQLGITRESAKAYEEETKAVGDAADRMGFYRQQVEKTSDSGRDAAKSIAEVQLAAARLHDYLQKLKREDSELDLEQQFIDLKEAAEDAWYATSTGAEDAREKQIDYQRSLNDTQQQLADYLTNVRGVPAEVTTAVLADVDTGKVTDFKQMLATMQKYYDVYVRVHLGAPNLSINSGGDVIGMIQTVPGKVSWYASGTDSARKGLAVVGEKGPELVNFGGGESVMPADETARALSASGGGTNNTFIVYTQATNGEELARELKEYMRRNGGRL